MPESIGIAQNPRWFILRISGKKIYQSFPKLSWLAPTIWDPAIRRYMQICWQSSENCLCHIQTLATSITKAFIARSVNMAPYAFPLVRFWALKYGPNKTEHGMVNSGASFSLASVRNSTCCSRKFALGYFFWFLHNWKLISPNLLVCFHVAPSSEF